MPICPFWDDERAIYFVLLTRKPRSETSNLVYSTLCCMPNICHFGHCIRCGRIFFVKFFVKRYGGQILPICPFWDDERAIYFVLLTRKPRSETSNLVYSTLCCMPNICHFGHCIRCGRIFFVKFFVKIFDKFFSMQTVLHRKILCSIRFIKI